MTLITSNTVTETIIGGTCTTDADCECGKACVGGTCQSLIPYKINVDSLVQKYPFWMLYDNCLGSGCSGFEGESLNACKFGSGLCNNTPFEFVVTGTVTDSNGHGVGCVPLSYSGATSGKVPYSSDQDEATFSWGIASDGKTDKDGNFKMVVTMNAALTAVKGCTIFTTPTQEVHSFPFTFDVTIQAVGYQNVSAQTLFSIDNTICEQNAV